MVIELTPLKKEYRLTAERKELVRGIVLGARSKEQGARGLFYLQLSTLNSLN
jgi:hypothetical protein